MAWDWVNAVKVATPLSGGKETLPHICRRDGCKFEKDSCKDVSWGVESGVGGETGIGPRSFKLSDVKEVSTG